MNDLLTKGHFKGLDIAFSCAVTTGAVNEIVVRHDCDPVAAHILGRALTGALLSAAILPEAHRLNVCWKYRGALRTIVADAGQDGAVRGFISPAQLDLTPDDKEALYGDLGELQVVTSRGGKVVNSGTAPVSFHDVAEDLAYYHCISDQVETSLQVMIGFNPDPVTPVKICQGWMIQALPNCDLERFGRIREKMNEPALRDLLRHENHVETIARALVSDESDFEGLHMEAGISPQFVCPCDRKKMSAVVRTLPIPERMELAQKKEDVEIRCQFCNTLYALTIDDCIAAWNEKPDS